MNVMPENVSTYGGQLDSLTGTIFWFALVWFLIAAGCLIFFMIKYRKRDGVKASYLPGNEFKHAKWLYLIIILVTLSDGIIDVKNMSVWDTIENTPPKADVEVKITGRMWNWIFTYPGPDGKLDTSDDVVVDAQNSALHVPVNKNVVFHLGARDVLHAFWVKEFRLKQDAIPGRWIKRWFNATKTGRYELACAEICGVMHAQMRNFIVVESEEEYQKFLSSLYDRDKSKQLTLR